MKKYVLNIDKLYSGQTASALVLSQVDEDFPTLLPSIQGDDDVQAWIDECRKIHPDFLEDVDPSTDVDELNKKVVEFNLSLQQKFKSNFHKEAYLLDDTTQMKPNGENRTFDTDKLHLHGLNGNATMVDENGNDATVNSSQLNVLFPFKKVNAKSMYARQLKVTSSREIDDILEVANSINLQGRVSYEKCMQDVQSVGENVYVMSSNVNLKGDVLQGNGIPVVNGVDDPSTIPHTMSLFQPSKDSYEQSGIDEFINWYKLHNRKTVVSLSDDYGTNVSYLKYFGVGSYELELATYGPTSIWLEKQNSPDAKRVVELNSSSFNQIRQEVDARNVYQDGKYVIGNNSSGSVGFFFNLYDNFLSEQDRTLRLKVPIDGDYNKLLLKFGVRTNFEHDENDQFEIAFEVYVNQALKMRFEGMDVHEESITVPIMNTNVEEHEMDITVRISYNVDYAMRSGSDEYVQKLKNSGVLLRNIRLENGINAPSDQLTFGSYINEDGISDKEKAKRCNQFWSVSQFKRDIAYQTIVETSMSNVLNNGVKYRNNYSSGDIYGDMFVTKSVLDPQYDMHLESDGTILHAIGRDYIGLGSCSNQLSLLFRQTDMELPIDAEDGTSARVKDDDELKYQMVEVVKNINRFESSIKHKSNVFSVVVENSNLAKDESSASDETLEKYKEQLRNSVTQFVRDVCEGIVPVHTQLFDVQFT